MEATVHQQQSSVLPGSHSPEMEEIRQMVQACIQCGTCTGSCANEFAMDLTPRKLWRMVLMGREEEIFASRTFCLCSACYYCTLRCPRGLPLTEAMYRLKQVAAQRKVKAYRASEAFYSSFLESVRRHGRVRESEFMTLYFKAMKNPLLPFRFASLGLKLMAKGKVDFKLPGKGNLRLASLFQRVAEIESQRFGNQVKPGTTGKNH